VKSLRGEVDDAIDWLDDARTRCVRIDDAYRWVEVYCQDALCEVSIAHGFDGATRFVDELEQRAAATGIREYVARAYVHRHRLGDEGALATARVLASGVSNPALHGLFDSAGVAGLGTF